MKTNTTISEMSLDLLDSDNKLYQLLATSNPSRPLWWNKLKDDPTIHIEIRKNNIIEAYYYGGLIAKINYNAEKDEIECLCHKKYLNDTNESSNNQYVPCINELNCNLTKLKENIIRYYVTETEGEDIREKRIQGRLLLDNPYLFIDSEFEHRLYNEENATIRFDLVSISDNKINIIELKSIKDNRLHTGDMTKNPPEILSQMERYHIFIEKNSDALIKYYIQVLKIKKMIGLPIPSGFNSNEKLEINRNPILIIKNTYQHNKMLKPNQRFDRISDIRGTLDKNKIKYYFLP